jgi:fructose-1,6-bisphosphatase I/sedoheptulose-1,7-bisphosphatase/fructose-1,6-bisphosphatase I
MKNNESNLQNISSYLNDNLKKNTDFHSLLNVLNEIVKSVKEISRIISYGEIGGVLGNLKTENIQGEVQKKLDVYSNDIFINNLSTLTGICALISEENENPIFLDKSGKGKYIIFFDPLDGSSNIDVNGSVGSIFSVYKITSDNIKSNNLLKQGCEQVVAGYSVYGPSSMLVITLLNGVDCFTLDNLKSDFFLTQSNLVIPQNTNEYSINSSNERFWEPPILRYISECRAGSTGIREKDFNMRWTGSMVADVHRILMRGGIFMYPKDSKIPKREGRLRLMYEANPMALIIEQAGGLASTGRVELLKINPDSFHQRVPVILGAAEEVNRLNKYFTQFETGEDKEYKSPLFKNRSLFSEN